MEKLGNNDHFLDELLNDIKPHNEKHLLPQFEESKKNQTQFTDESSKHSQNQSPFSTPNDAFKPYNLNVKTFVINNKIRSYWKIL